MKSGGIALAAALAVCILGACGDRQQSKEAVRRGIVQGVSKRGVNVDAMDVDVTAVRFDGNKADATVAFVPKGGKLSDGLTMRYQLEKQGNDWVIVGRSQMDMKQHAGSAQASPDANGEALPAGHPALNGNAPPPSAAAQSSGPAQ